MAGSVGVETLVVEGSGLSLGCLILVSSVSSCVSGSPRCHDYRLIFRNVGSAPFMIPFLCLFFLGHL